MSRSSRSIWWKKKPTRLDAWSGSGGSDGDSFLGSRLATIRHADPDVLLITLNYTLPVPPQHTLKIPPERWPEIQAAYRTRSLRSLALEWNVSQETIRKIVQA